MDEVDIPYHKLLDWLSDRNMIPINWDVPVKKIRAKIDSALEDMPSVPEVVGLLSNNYVDYFISKKVLSLMESSSEEGGTNLFGMYKSKRTKDWASIVRDYEDKNVFIAEAAQILSREGVYEIPALKRRITKCQNSAAAWQRKKVDLEKGITEFEKKYDNACKDLGVDPNGDLASQIEELPKNLGTVFSDVVAACMTPDVKDAVEFYSAFTQLLLSAKKPNRGSDSPVDLGDVSSVVKTLQRVQREGNTTIAITDLTAHGQPESEATKNDISTSGGGIDWGDLGSADGDVADSPVSNTSGVVEVDWEKIKAEAKEDATAGSSSNIANGSKNGDTGSTGDGDGGIDSSVEIDWGDFGDAVVAEPESPGEGPATDADWEIVLEDSGEDSGLTLLEDRYWRTKFVDDVVELTSFLESRLDELEEMDATDMVMSSMMMNAGNILERADAVYVRRLLAGVRAVLAAIEGSRARQLLMIKSSRKYRERLLCQINNYKNVAQKFRKSLSDAARHLETEQKEALSLKPDLDRSISLVLRLKESVEPALSEILKGRRVHLTGDINTLKNM